MSAAWKKYEGWIQTGCTVLIVLALSFFDGRYVAADSYQKDQEKNAASLRTIEASMNTASTAIVLLQDQTKLLSDHESRIRALERRLPATAMVVPGPRELLTLSEVLKE